MLSCVKGGVIRSKGMLKYFFCKNIAFTTKASFPAEMVFATDYTDLHGLISYGNIFCQEAKNWRFENVFFHAWVLQWQNHCWRKPETIRVNPCNL